MTPAAELRAIAGALKATKRARVALRRTAKVLARAAKPWGREVVRLAKALDKSGAVRSERGSAARTQHLWIELGLEEQFAELARLENELLDFKRRVPRAKPKRKAKKRPAKKRTKKAAKKGSRARARAPKRTAPSRGRAPASTVNMSDQEQVLGALRELDKKHDGGRILLHELRDRLPHMSRLGIDRQLKALSIGGLITLMGMDNPMERTPAVEAGALFIAGHPRHLVYMQPSGRANTPEDQVLEALELATRRSPSRGLHMLGDVRELTPDLSKEQFDKAVLRLMHERRAIVHHGDFFGSLTDEDKRRHVLGPNKTYYVGIAKLRR